MKAKFEISVLVKNREPEIVVSEIAAIKDIDAAIEELQNLIKQLSSTGYFTLTDTKNGWFYFRTEEIQQISIKKYLQ
jgi:stage III sporulation protein SpoIIIAA